MKNLSTIALVLGILTFIPSISNAQDTTIVKVGAMLAPQAGLNLKDADALFNESIPYFGTIQIVKKKTSCTLFYNFANNSVGTAIERSLTNNWGTYLVGTKNIQIDGGYAGIGTDYSIADGRAFIFIELGSSWNSWNPAIYTGIFIPFNYRIR